MGFAGWLVRLCGIPLCEFALKFWESSDPMTNLLAPLKSTVPELSTGGLRHDHGHPMASSLDVLEKLHRAFVLPYVRRAPSLVRPPKKRSGGSLTLRNRRSQLGKTLANEKKILGSVGSRRALFSLENGLLATGFFGVTGCRLVIRVPAMGHHGSSSGEADPSAERGFGLQYGVLLDLSLPSRVSFAS